MKNLWREKHKGEKKKIKYTYVLKSFIYITRRLREARLEKKKNAIQLFFFCLIRFLT